MASQSLVEVGVIGIQKVDQAAVFLQDRPEKELRFPAHGPPQWFVKVGKSVGVGLSALQIPQLQPLPGKIFHQGVGPGILEHPRHLLSQDLRIAKLAVPGQIKELVVGQAAPEKVGETRGEFVRAYRVMGTGRAGLRIEFKAKEKMGRGQDGLKSQLDSSFQGLSVTVSRRYQVAQPFDLPVGCGPAVGSQRQVPQNGIGAALQVCPGIVTADQDPAMTVGQGLWLHIERTQDFHGIGIDQAFRGSPHPVLPDRLVENPAQRLGIQPGQRLQPMHARVDPDANVEGSPVVCVGLDLKGLKGAVVKKDRKGG